MEGPVKDARRSEERLRMRGAPFFPLPSKQEDKKKLEAVSSKINSFRSPRRHLSVPNVIIGDLQGSPRPSSAAGRVQAGSTEHNPRRSSAAPRLSPLHSSTGLHKDTGFSPAKRHTSAPNLKVSPKSYKTDYSHVQSRIDSGRQRTKIPLTLKSSKSSSSCTSSEDWSSVERDSSISKVRPKTKSVNSLTQQEVDYKGNMMLDDLVPTACIDGHTKQDVVNLSVNSKLLKRIRIDAKSRVDSKDPFPQVHNMTHTWRDLVESTSFAFNFRFVTQPTLVSSLLKRRGSFSEADTTATLERKKVGLVFSSHRKWKSMEDLYQNFINKEDFEKLSKTLPKGIIWNVSDAERVFLDTSESDSEEESTDHDGNTGSHFCGSQGQPTAAVSLGDRKSLFVPATKEPGLQPTSPTDERWSLQTSPTKERLGLKTPPTNNGQGLQTPPTSKGCTQDLKTTPVKKLQYSKKLHTPENKTTRRKRTVSPQFRSANTCRRPQASDVDKKKLQQKLPLSLRRYSNV